MPFCIPKELTRKFILGLKTGKIDAKKLSTMSSENRRTYLKDYLGETSAEVNKMIEKEFLGKGKKEFITDEEVQKITELTKKIQDTKSKINEDMPDRSPERLEYGTSKALLQNYVGELKLSGKDFSYYLKNPGKTFIELSGATKSILTSLDNSFFGRQGLKTLLTNPDIWGKNFLKSWGDIGKELKGEDAMIPIKADVLSRKNALNGKYKDGDFAVGVKTEEAYPSSLPEKIPLLGRLFKASESAFNGAALRMRADLADRYIAKAEKGGKLTPDSVIKELKAKEEGLSGDALIEAQRETQQTIIENTKQLQSLGKLVNSLTGRGNLGKKLEGMSEEINATFFSLKFLKSSFDTLTAHVFDTKMSVFAKKQAAINLAEIVGGIATTMIVANLLQPGSVEYDPRSADFGKIKIGATRFDITGGMASLATLSARVATFATKSTTTGKVSQLNSGKYNSKTAWDVLDEFGQGKLAPFPGVVIDFLKGQDYNYKKPTALSSLQNLTVPMPVSDFQDLMNNPESADILAAMLASELGISIQTY